MKIKYQSKIIWLGIIGMAIVCISVFNPIDLIKEAVATYFNPSGATDYEIAKYGTTLQFKTATKNYTLEDLATDTSGITTLNGLTATTQTFATGTTGTDFNVSSATSTHTLNIPSSSAANRGLLTSANWDTFNNKEPAIATGAVTTYWRGDKSFQTLNQAAVAGLTTADSPTLTGLTLSGLSQGGLLFASPTGQLIQDATQLYWNDTNNRLGIGTTIPSFKLDMQEDINGIARMRFKNTNSGSAAQSYINAHNDLDDQSALLVYSSTFTGTLYTINRARLAEVRLDGSGGAMVDTGFSGGNLYLAAGANTTHIPAITIDPNENVGFSTITQFGGGAGVIGLANATTAPTSAPTGGIILYAVSGACKLYRSDGQVLNIGYPSGVIMMWSGSVASIPSGWVLCDGTNGTPDLRDRFIVGAKQDDGGVAKTNITGSLTQSGGSISYTPAGTVASIAASGAAAVKVGTAASNAEPSGHTHAAPAFTGTGATIIPPYFSLCYIMKT